MPTKNRPEQFGAVWRFTRSWFYVFVAEHGIGRVRF